MARTLDFNTLAQPTLEMVMRDEKKTHINVTAPSYELLEKLEANMTSITDACKKKDIKSLQVGYDLAAELVSCNMEGIKVTGQELREKYGVDYTLLFAFLIAYMDFINDIKQAKN